MKWQTVKRVVFGAALTASVALLAACGSSNTASKTGSYKDELLTKNTLTVGFEGTYAPYSYRKDGKLAGFEVDLSKAIAKQMGLKVAFKPTKWDSLIAGLGSGKFDIVLNNLAETKQRKESYLLTTPYAYSHYVMISASKKPLTDASQAKGKKFGQSTGSDNATIAKKLGATVVPVEQFATTLSMVKDGRIDGNINSLPSWYAYKADNATTGLTMKELPDSVAAPAKIEGMLNKKSPKTTKEVTKAIKALQKDGTIKKLSQKYFGTDISK